jgi:sRNA-binding carbon storage regulator CsrA
MRVFTRKPGGQLVFPNCDLVVTVIGIKGKKVRLGLFAPQSQAPYHGEVSAAPSARRRLASREPDRETEPTAEWLTAGKTQSRNRFGKGTR